jgi:hypothetical protein
VIGGSFSVHAHPTPHAAAVGLHCTNWRRYSGAVDYQRARIYMHIGSNAVLSVYFNTSVGLHDGVTLKCSGVPFAIDGGGKGVEVSALANDKIEHDTDGSTKRTGKGGETINCGWEQGVTRRCFTRQRIRIDANL